MDNKTLAIVARILGALFYYPPKSNEARPLLTALQEMDQFANWQNPAQIHQLCQGLKSAIDADKDNHRYHDLTYQHSALFEGQGSMQAPPWGSVYLDSEQLLMGKSCEHYRAFLHQHGIRLDTGINEPEDQFGLMLMAFALLIEKKEINAAKQLINEHLLTWAPAYLDKLAKNTLSPFYQALAEIAQQYLDALAKC